MVSSIEGITRRERERGREGGARKGEEDWRPMDRRRQKHRD